MAVAVSMAGLRASAKVELLAVPEPRAVSLVVVLAQRLAMVAHQRVLMPKVMPKVVMKIVKVLQKASSELAMVEGVEVRLKVRLKVRLQVLLQALLQVVLQAVWKLQKLKMPKALSSSFASVAVLAEVDVP